MRRFITKSLDCILNSSLNQNSNDKLCNIKNIKNHKGRVYKVVSLKTCDKVTGLIREKA